MPELARPHEPAERPAQELADWTVNGDRARVRLSLAGLAIQRTYTVGGGRSNELTPPSPSRIDHWFVMASRAKLGPCVGTEQCLGEGRILRRGVDSGTRRRPRRPRPQQKKEEQPPGATQFPSCLSCVAAPAVIGWSAAVGFGLGIDALTPCCQGLGLNFSCRGHCDHTITTPSPSGRFVSSLLAAHVSLPNNLDASPSASSSVDLLCRGKCSICRYTSGLRRRRQAVYYLLAYLRTTTSLRS